MNSLSLSDRLISLGLLSLISLLHFAAVLWRAFRHNVHGALEALPCVGFKFRGGFLFPWIGLSHERYT
jgi:hypothetical protein